MAAYIDIGAFQYETDDTPTPMDIGGLQQVAPSVPSGGQVISIITTKLFISCIWLKQGKGNRRYFLKNTLLASMGIR